MAGILSDIGSWLSNQFSQKKVSVPKQQPQNDFLGQVQQALTNISNTKVGKTTVGGAIGFANNQTAQGFGNAFNLTNKAVVQPTIKALQTGAPAVAKIMMPSLNNLAQQNQKYYNQAVSQGVQPTSFVQGLVKQQQPLSTPLSLNDVGNAAGFVGAFNPISNMVGGAVGVGFNAVGNVMNNKPVLSNAGKAYNEGFAFNTKLGPISGLASPGVKPFTRILGKSGAAKIVSKGLEGAAGMGTYGLLEPAKNNEERLKNAASQALQGFLFNSAIEGSGQIFKHFTASRIPFRMQRTMANDAISEINNVERLGAIPAESNLSTTRDAVKKLFNIDIPKYDYAQAKANPNYAIEYSNRLYDVRNLLDKVVNPAEMRSEIKLPQKPVDKILQERIAKSDNALKQDRVGVSGKVKNFWDSFKEKIVDSNSPITDVLDSFESKNKIKITPREDVRLQLPKVKASDTIADNFSRTNGLVDVIKSVDKPSEFSQYLQAKHQLTGDTTASTGLDIKESKQIVEALAQKYEPYAQKIREFTRKLLDYRVETGLMSRETADSLIKKYPDYVPVNRVFSPEELSSFSKQRGVASVSSTGMYTRKGSERAIVDPLFSLLEGTRSTFRTGEANKAASMIAQYKDIPNNPFELKLLKQGETAPHFISVFENGKQVKYATTPEVESVAKNLNTEQAGFIAKLFNTPVRILKVGATGVLNPVFTIANYVKDQGTALINSDKALNTSLANPVNFVKSLFALTGKGADYEAMLREGLGGGTSFDIYRDNPKLTIEGIRSGRSIGSKIKYLVRNPGELLRAAEDVLGSTEKLTRNQQFIGTRDALVKQGRTLEDATLLAAKAYRENTVDFSRSGTWGKVINQFIPYFNAGVQGSRTFIDTMKRNPAGAAAKIAITIFTPMALATAWNNSDPKRQEAYNDIQDFEKKNNFIIVPPNPIKDERGSWNVIKIPIPQEVAYMANLVRKVVEQTYGQTVVGAKDLISAISGTITPYDITDPQEMTSSMTPQIIKSELEIATNKNLFTGKDVVPSYLKNLPPDQQVYPWTSGTARIVGKATGMSPITVENAVGTNLATGGKILLNASDKVLNKAGVIPEKQIGGSDITQGFARRFASAAGGKTKDVTDKQLTKDLTNKEQQAYDLLHAYTQKDANGKSIDSGSVLNSQQKAILYLNNPKLQAVDAIKQQQQPQHDPIWDLSPQWRNIVFASRIQLPGQKNTYDQYLAQQPWYKEFTAKQSAYYDKFPDTSSSSAMKYPTPSEYVQKQMDAKNWKDPEVKAYLDALTTYKNNQLAQLGLPSMEGTNGYPQYQKKVSAKKLLLPKVSSIKIKKGSLPKIPKISAYKAPKIKITKGKTSKLAKLLTQKPVKTNIKLKV